MPDMLVRLYDLPEVVPYDKRAYKAGITVRRAEAWDRPRLREFISANFLEIWALEAERCFGQTPISCFVGVQDRDIVGFAAYEVTRRNYFGPTGVREDLRGVGLGAALLFRCLHSLRELGYAYAIIGGVGPAEFYEKVCGALAIPGSEVGIYGSLFAVQPREQA